MSLSFAACSCIGMDVEQPAPEPVRASCFFATDDPPFNDEYDTWQRNPRKAAVFTA
jgi:hypothetical protein